MIQAATAMPTDTERCVCLQYLGSSSSVWRVGYVSDDSSLSARKARRLGHAFQGVQCQAKMFKDIVSDMRYVTRV
jgi:hypothetical protein